MSRKEFLSFDVSHLNLTDGCFAFTLFNKFSRFVLLPVHKKNILSIDLRYMSKNVLISEYMNFPSKCSIKMFAYGGGKIVPITEPFISEYCWQLKIL